MRNSLYSLVVLEHGMVDELGEHVVRTVAMIEAGDLASAVLVDETDTWLPPRPFADGEPEDDEPMFDEEAR